MSCVLCETPSSPLLFEDARLRVILVDAAK